MPEVAFNETIAATYDTDSAEMFEPGILEPAVDFLASVAAGGSALEFGIGTGRVALPLSERGVRVQGIDISEPMVARMRTKAGGDAIGVTFGDIATTRVPGEFDLVYLVFNVITNLTTQDEQVRCFANVAAHLRPGGAMVAEVFVPQLQRLLPVSAICHSRSRRSTWASMSTTWWSSSARRTTTSSAMAARRCFSRATGMPGQPSWT